MSKETKKMVMLFSVGCAFDKETGNTFPIMDEGKIDFDNPVNIFECEPEWFDNLHLLDFDVVKNWFADEDLDIEAMLTNDWLDNYCEENPDFDMAMNGIDIY